MSPLVGTGALMRLILRRDRILMPIWIVLLALVVIGVASSFAQLYPTPESRQGLAGTIAASPAITAMLGPLFDLSIGGLTAWRVGGIMAVVVALISLLTVIRHTRTEEEAGRRELLGATVVGRHAPLSAALTMTLAANLVFAAVVAGGLTVLGLPASGSVALGLSFAAAGWVFAAMAGLAAQLTESAGRAKGISVAVLGLSYLLRFIGDSGGENGRLSWLSWLSPIGWVQRTRPFADESWWILALFAGTSVVVAIAAYALASRRDLGAGILPPRLGPASASPSLRTPLALAWRLQRGPLRAWTIGFAVVGLVIGSAAQGIADLLTTSPQLEAIFARIGGQGVLVDTFLSAIMSIAGLVAAAYAVQAALRLRSEEERMRAEPVLATSVGRLRWAASHLGFAAFGPAILLVVVGVAAGLSYGLSAGNVVQEVPRAVVAAIVQLPAVWVLVGIAVGLFGLLPRFTAVTWALLVIFLLLGQLGQVLQLSQWMLDLSPFSHVPWVLVRQVSLAPLFWLVVVAAGLTVAGLAGLRRRDVG
ncbi:MAG: ABC transporter permease [Chloroflexota bacterium]|nr:MAG: ABC transporter permease [Chloroflexota bacterium]